MYSKKSAGPRMEPSGTPVLTGYYCKDFPSRTTWTHLLLRKEENKSKYLAWNPIRLEFVKKSSMPNPVKSLGYIRCYNWTSSSLLKDLAILSDTTVRRSAVDWEDLKPYWKSEKRPHSLGDQQSYYLEVLKRL